MSKPKKILSGLSLTAIPLLAISVTAGQIMESYQPSLDTYFNTLSYKVVSEETSEEDWIYESEFHSAEEAFEGYKDFAMRETEETNVLLKNTNNALPLQSDEKKVTLLGLRSYATIYSNSGGSIADTNTTINNQNRFYEVFQQYGYEANPDMLNVYNEYVKDMTFAVANPMSGLSAPEYDEITTTTGIPELSTSEIAAIDSNYADSFSEYNTAIVVLGRPGGEGSTYRPGTAGMDEGTETTTDNILGISSEEQEILDMAKENFSKVIVLINSVCQMDIKSLEEDDGIDAVMWIGYPGPYGSRNIALTLDGTVNPSGHLGDTYATNSALAPAMMNFGDDTNWADASSFESGAHVNSYLIEAEGIYTGYRYYETRYADSVIGRGNASRAKAGTYTGSDYKPATIDGTWDYEWEVAYPFGYGLSYTTFEQTLDSVSIAGDKKSAEVTVTVTNTGSVAGKDVVEVYAQSPYTDYDIDNKVEKSAIQLLDYEKTNKLDPGSSQTITMAIDLTNLASYDYTNAKTYILDDGDYYLAIGDDAHDALNNILANNYSVDDGMTSQGDAAKSYHFHFDDFDADTFSVSETGETITNKLSEGDYAMDFNAFSEDSVTYLTRNDWYNTFPKTYSNISSTVNSRLTTLLGCDFYEIETNDDVSAYQWDVDSGITLADMKQAEWDDDRWDDFIDQISIDEFLYFVEYAFHTVRGIESIGFDGCGCDDGPGGSDSHYFDEGSYQGVAWLDAEEYAGYGTRVGAGQINLAYTWNKELAYENGEIILGETSLCLGLPVMIGPGANIHRHAYNGRGGEYFSEDPILSGYTCSNVVQGAQSKGCLVNIKHAAFNDQEINRSGVAVFTNEQAARELELRNLEQAIVGNGKPASFENNAEYDDTFTLGALGIMTSYNRIGAVASSANYAVMVDIMRNEWGFKGYNVTDLSSVSLCASPKESILAGTTAFCGFGVTDASITYWDAASLQNDATMCEAIKMDLKYALYAIVNSNAVNGYNNTTHREWLMSSWRKIYISMEAVSASILGLATIGWITTEILDWRKKKGEASK